VRLIPVLLAVYTSAGCVDPSTTSGPETAWEPIPVDAQLAEAMPTVVHVRFEAEDADIGLVKFGTGDLLDREASATRTEDGTWEATLLGIPQDRQVGFQVEVESGGETRTSGPGEIRTGFIHLDLPAPTVELTQPDVLSPGFMVTTLLPDPSAAVIFDQDGEYVWAYSVGPEHKLNHSWISHDRAWVYLMEGVESGGDDPTAPMYRVRIDGSAVEEVALIDNWHHDALDLSDGALDLLALDQRMVEGTPVTGDKIMEIGPDGDMGLVWTAWDHLNPPGVDEIEGDWTHANALACDETADEWYLSLYALDTIVAVDRSGGDIRWAFGGDGGDFTLSGGEHAGFEQQHGFDVLGDNVLLFDNGSVERYSSRIEEYVLDVDAGTATLVWDYEPDPPLYCAFLGDAQRLPDGNTLATFSCAGQLDLVAPDGSLISRLTMPMTEAFWYTQWVPSLY